MTAADRDAGLQRERTRLAWRRTLLALTVVASLCVRLAIGLGATPGGLLVTAAAMVIWLAALVVTCRRMRALTVATAAFRSGSAGRALPLAAAASIGYAVLGAILLVSAPGR